MKLGSLFDGSGGFPLAGALCGIDPVWAAEVEPYPIAVTKSRFDGNCDTPLLAIAKKHFPNMKIYMKHLGSVIDVRGDKIEPVDIITFGSPCQDLSVAGKRAGLKHETEGDEETTRSGLFVEAVRIIKEMREATNGVYPRFAVWENVPGAFSSNGGQDFRIVLEKLIQVAEPTAVMPDVPKGGWAYADSYRGDGWSIAYRVFDAQYWGVPQRRRRIYLVADFRGECAGEVLFKSHGLRGYFEEGRAPWQGITPNAERGIAASETPYTFEPGIAQREGGHIYEGVSGTRGARAGDNRMAVAYGEPVTFDARGNGDGKVVSTITGAHESSISDYTSVVCMPIGDTVYALDRESYNCGQNFARTPGIADDGVAPTIIARGPGAVCYCVQDKAIGRKEANSCHGLGVTEETSYTLTGVDRHAVVYAVDQGGGKSSCSVTEGVAPTLTRTNDGSPVVCTDEGWLNNEAETTPTGLAKMHKEPHLVSYWDGGQTAGTLTANNAGGNQRMPDKENFNAVIESRPPRYIVRRLTPTECARLQGFPDNWGHPDKKDTFTKEEYEFWLDVRNTHAIINGKTAKNYTKDQMLSWYNKLHTDGAEYKMWGNGIALPNALYVMQGIADTK